MGPQGWTEEVPGAYSYKIGDLAAGASVVVQITIRLDSVLPAGVEEINNQVKGRDDGENGSETTITDNSDEEDTPVIATPDLVVTKTDNQTSVVPGQTLTYEIRVRNVGNQGATGVELVEKLPQYTTFIGPVNPDGWFYNSITDEYTYKIGNLAAGAEVTVTFIVKVDDSLPLGVTDIINLVTVSDDGENGADMNLDDNWAEDEDRTEVTAPPVSPPLVSYPQPAPTLTPRALPYTGFDSLLLLLTGLALLGAGIITVFLSPMPVAVFRRKR